MNLIIKNSLKFPAVVLAVCLLEMSAGNFFNFRVVYWFYAYIILFLFKLRSLRLLINSQGIVYYVIVIVLYLISVIFTGRIYETNKSELFNILWWTIFGSCLAIEFNNSDRSQIDKFFKWVSLLIFLGSVVTATGGIVKFFYMLSNPVSTYPAVFFFDERLIIGSSLNLDYNIYSLGLCLGLISGAYLKNSNKNRFFYIVYFIASLIISSAVFLSGSRRGFVFVVITLIIAYTWRFYKTGQSINYHKIISWTSLLSGAIFLLIFIFYEPISDYMTSGELKSGSVVRLFTLKDELGSENERTIRWDYFYELTHDYSASNFLFGNGFDYLSEYGNKFEGVAEDNPHNFFMATFLYGGFFSIVALLILITLVGIRLVRQENFIVIFFFYLYLILFSLTSSNTLFSYRLFPVICTISLLTIKSEKIV